MTLQMKFLDAVLVGMAPDTAETAAARLEEAMKAAAPEARKKREEWKTERRLRLAEKLELSDYEIDTMLEGALDESTLAGDYQIEVQLSPETDPISVSVSDILSDKKTYDHALTRDPIEPDYDGGRIVGKLFLNEDNPVLVSQARGGATYQLLPEADKSGVARISIEYSPERNDLFIDECITQMHQTGAFFRSGMTIVHMRNGHADPVTEPRLAYELSKIVLPYQVKTTRLGETRSTIRFDRNLLGQIMEVAPDRLPILNGSADHPLLLPDGALITKPGYNAASGLFILNGAARFPPIYSEPTEAQLKEAVATCMRPFRGYRFDDDFGKTATIFAVMLAVLRPVFSCAPMIVTTSLKTGVGKGYFQQALAAIRTGEVPELRNVESKNLSDLPPAGPSLMTSVCGFGLDSRRFRAGQARRARSPQIAQASGALRPVFCSRAMSVA